MEVLVPIILFVGSYAFIYFASIGVMWLITLCFGWTFSWPIATGVWLLWCIAKSIFSHK